MDRPRVHVARIASCLLAGVLACGVVLGVSPAAAFDTSYRIVDLGGLPGGSGANGVSRDGAAAGYEMIGPNVSHAVLFQGGQVLDLGTLGGDASNAYALRSGGRVVGWARLPDSTRHAFLWESGSMRDLGTIGGRNSEGVALNDSGLVVGWSEDSAAGNEWPVRWSAAGGMQIITLAGSVGGRALDINDAGMVVGYFIDGVRTVPFAWSPTWASALPTLSTYGSKAYGISANGLIVGYSLTPGVQPYFHAVLWDAGGVHDLGALPGGHSVANAVNSSGSVVGFSYELRNGEPEMVAAVFDGSSIYDLNHSLPADTQWQLAMANGVTEDGVITGVGFLEGVQRAWAMVPTRLQTPPWGQPSVFAHAGLRAWPEPMQRTGTLELDLPAATRGRVALYDVNGRRVATVAEGDFTRGRVWLDLTPQLGQVGPGVYYAHFEGVGASASRRVVVIR